MKTLQIILAAIAIPAIAALGILYFIFKPSHIPNGYRFDTEIIWDVSDTFLLSPNWQEIWKGFELDENIWNSGELGFTSISDVEFNKEYRIFLGKDDPEQVTNYVRHEAIANFKIDFDTLKVRTGKIVVGRDSSTVFASIGNILNRMSISDADVKRCYIYSDLQENHGNFSTIAKTRNTTDPEVIRQHILNVTPLHDLTGITVIFRYQPESIEEDRRFKKVVEIYREILMQRGAEVEISADKETISNIPNS